MLATMNPDVATLCSRSHRSESVAPPITAQVLPHMISTRETWDQSRDAREWESHLRIAVDRLQVGHKDQEALQDLRGCLVVFRSSLVHAQVLSFSAPIVAGVSLMGYQ